ncbi:polysaccharide lyase family 8 super-sandwich domain-containing protein [Paenibacillus senegalensis]|uniref:polysaccharide lyase family 8 super-sandwich domain-containing protein n=1 Tax=Paenibacillus senegalensis TaxID=1465766 RepID=UPI00028933EB|nr:polysaccharide lyase family 8 super-sandwich domain-containing protein [Paenibacillus senegalensis]
MYKHGKKKKLLPIGIILLCLLLALPIVTPAALANESADAYDVLRQKWFDVLVGGSDFNPNDPDFAAKIEALADSVQNGETGFWDRLQTGADRADCNCLFTDLLGTEASGHIVVAYDRLKTMALAYITPGSRLEGNAMLKEAVVDALDWMYENRYNENTVRYGNWYHWEMSGPQNLLDTVILMYPELTSEQIENYMKGVDHFSPDPNLINNTVATGANRVEKVWTLLLRSVLLKDGDMLELAKHALSDNTGTPTSTNGENNVFAYTLVPETDGMHPDGSFLQHGPHPYIGNYGTTFLQLLAGAVYLLNDSPWEITDPELPNLYQWIHDSFEPTMYNGAQMDMIRGRLISNESVQTHVAGHRVIQGVIMLSTFAPPEHASAYQSMVKTWVTEDTYRNFLTTAPIWFAQQAKMIVEDSSIPARGDLVMNKIFPLSDRVVHHREGFSFGLSMSSSRIYRYESINGNNLHGWRTGDGVTYLYNGDLGHYDDHYWPTVDMYRLPGITTDKQTLGNAAGQSTKTPHSWVGGASDGEFAAIGMQFTPFNSSLTGKKSWFLFDDEIVALGAEITSTDSREVETIIDNRKLNEDGDNQVHVDGELQSASLTEGTQLYPGAKWLHLEGSMERSDIGYFFPEGEEIHGLREARTGSWGDIQGGTPSDPITRNYYSLSIDHGTNPLNESYQYAILPNKSISQTADYADQPDFIVLENSGDVQAVKETKLNMIGANFWTNAPTTVAADGSSWITSSGKASVLTKESEERLEVTVSDPTQLNKGTIDLEIHREATGIRQLDPAITVVRLSPTIQLSVDVNDARGASFGAVFTLGNPHDTEPPTPPAQVTASIEGYNSVRLDWEASTDNTGIAGYRIYRNGAEWASVITPGYVDEHVEPGSYEYQVVAYDPAGNLSSYSDAVQVTIEADTTPPSVPAGLTAQAVSASRIDLAWEASVDDISGVAGYNVYRNEEKIATVNALSYSDLYLIPAQEYVYSVTAFDGAGHVSAPSSPVQASTPTGSVFLINDSFDAEPTGDEPTGYVIDRTGGSASIVEVPDSTNKSVKFEDVSSTRSVVAAKSFDGQQGKVAAEFDIMLPARSSYHSWNLQGDGTRNAVTVMISGNNLIYKNSQGGDTVLQAYEPGTWYTVKIEADPASQLSTIYVNGIPRAVDAAFRFPVSTIERFAASTGMSGTGIFYLDNVKVYLPFLTETMKSAEWRLDNAVSGTQLGQFPQLAIDQLNSVWLAAQAVHDDPLADTSSKDQAALELVDAMKQFDGSVIRLDEVFVDTEQKELLIGEETQLILTGITTAGAAADLDLANITFDSSDGAVAEVDPNGKITAKGAGKVTVHVYAEFKGITVTSSIELRVYEAKTPVTSAWLNPEKPDGDNGWYRSPVTLTLSAAPSTVTEIVYRLDSSADWQPYRTPLEFLEDGEYTISFRSIAAGGLEEEAQTISFRIDSLAPTILLPVENGAVYSTAEAIPLVITASDDGSGIDEKSLTVTLNGRSLTAGSELALYTLPLGHHTLIASVRDLAGNESEITAAFTLETSLESLSQLVALFQANGEIGNHGIANSLQAKLKNQQLEPFIKQVRAQSGKHISEMAAHYLLRDAEALLP